MLIVLFVHLGPTEKHNGSSKKALGPTRWAQRTLEGRSTNQPMTSKKTARPKALGHPATRSRLLGRQVAQSTASGPLGHSAWASRPPTRPFGMCLSADQSLRLRPQAFSAIRPVPLSYRPIRSQPYT